MMNGDTFFFDQIALFVRIIFPSTFSVLREKYFDLWVDNFLDNQQKIVNLK